MFITDDVKIIDNHIVLGNPVKDSKMNTWCTKSCVLQYKEHIQSRLYQKQLNCFVRPGAAGLLIGIECSRVRDSPWMYLTVDGHKFTF